MKKVTKIIIISIISFIVVAVIIGVTVGLTLKSTSNSNSIVGDITGPSIAPSIAPSTGPGNWKLTSFANGTQRCIDTNIFCQGKALTQKDYNSCMGVESC